MKRLLIWVTVAVGGLVAFAGIAIGLVVLFFPAQRIKEMVIPSLEKSLGRSVRVERAGVTVFPRLGVRLSGLEISNTQRAGFSTDPCVRLGSFTLSVKLGPLLRKRIEVHQIILDRLQVLVEVDSFGAYNFDDMPILKKGPEVSPQEKKPRRLPELPVPLSLELFEIRNGTVMYNDMKAGRRVSLGTIDQRVILTIDSELRDIVLRGNLIVNNIEVATREISRPLSGLKLTFSHDVRADLVGGIATIEQLSLTLQKLAFTAHGTVRGIWDTMAVDLRLQTDTLAVEDLLAEVPLSIVPVISKIVSRGRVWLDLHVKGTVGAGGKPEVSGALLVRELNIRHADFPKSVSQGTIDVWFGNNELEVRQFAVRIGESPITARATVRSFVEPWVSGALRADVNLAEVKDIVKLPDGVSLSGKLVADIRAEGRVDLQDPTTIAVDGRMDLSNVVLSAPQIRQPLSVNGAVEFSPTAVRTRLSAVVGNSSADLEVKVAKYLAFLLSSSKRASVRPEILFTLRSPNLNVDEILPKKDTAQFGAKARGAQESPDATTLILAKPLPGIDLQGVITCARLTNEGTTFSELRSEIRHRNDIGEVNVKAKLYGGSLEARVSLDIRDYRSIGYTLDAVVDRVQMNDFVSAFNDRLVPSSTLMRALRETDNTLYGVVTIQAAFKGRGGTKAEIQNSLDGRVTMSASQGRIAATNLVRSFSRTLERIYKFDDVSFDQLRGEFRIAGERLIVDTLRMFSSLGDIGARGSVGFDGSYDVLVCDRLPRSVSERLLTVQNQGTQALRGLFEGTALARAADAVLDRTAIPADKDGRVTVNIRLEGTTAEPRVRLTGFGGQGSSGAVSPQAAVKEVIKEKTEELKQKGAEVLREEAKKLEEKLPSETQKQVEDLKKKGSKTLRGLLGR